MLCFCEASALVSGIQNNCGKKSITIQFTISATDSTQCVNLANSATNSIQCVNLHRYKELEEDKYRDAIQYVAGGTALNVARAVQVCPSLFSNILKTLQYLYINQYNDTLTNTKIPSFEFSVRIGTPKKTNLIY